MTVNRHIHISTLYGTNTTLQTPSVNYQISLKFYSLILCLTMCYTLNKAVDFSWDKCSPPIVICNDQPVTRTTLSVLTKETLKWVDQNLSCVIRMW